MTGVTSSVLRAVNKPGAGRSRNPDNKSLGLYLDIASPSTPEGSAPGPPTHDTPRASKEPENNHPPQKRSCSDDGDIHSAAHTPSGVFSRVHMARPQPFGELRDAKRARSARMEAEEPSQSSERVADMAEGPVPGPDSRHKGPCSYEQCPNPHHSSGGGFKVVTADTKAGNRCWAEFRGRVFCNACFTQFATRGTFQRPGRNLPAGGVAPTLDMLAPPSPVVHARTAPVSRGGEQRFDARFESRGPPKPLGAVAKALPEQMDVEESDDARYGVAVCLELLTEGRNLRYQWLRDGRPISGGESGTLRLEGVECRGDISCIVSNEWGTTPAFAPIRLPARTEDAHRKLLARKQAPPLPREYNLRCVCGEVTRGAPEELSSLACKCGRVCCGEAEPIRQDCRGG